MTSLACVIPAYNAAATIAAVAKGVRTALPECFLVIVDDGSRDETGPRARAVSDALVSFSTNRGKGVAIRAGVATALQTGASSVVMIDADGQHDPLYAPALMHALLSADVVIGARSRTRGVMPWTRRVTNVLSAAAVSAIAGVQVIDPQSGFRAIRREVLERVSAVGDRYDYETDFLLGALRAGFRVASVPVPTTYGAPSHFRLLSDSARVVRALWRHHQGGGEEGSGSGRFR